MAFYVSRAEKFKNELKTKMVFSSQELKGFSFTLSDYKLDKNSPPDNAEWTPAEKYIRLTENNVHIWFKGEFKTPKLEKEQAPYFKLITAEDSGYDSSNPQCLVYLNGKAIQGIDKNHTEIKLENDKEYQILIYYFAEKVTDTLVFEPTLNVIDENTEKLYFDILSMIYAANCFKTTDEIHINYMKHLDRAIDLVDMRDIPYKDYQKSVKNALSYLEENFFKAECGKSDNGTVSVIGHTHIDVAWLWRVCQTAEKAQRSFSTVINLMKHYPEYKFMLSQPVLYEFVKENLPEIYAEVKKAVKDGRWEVEGAMWLEADCNITGGESFVRQLIFGKRFFKEEFGVECKTLWLPDVFGYSAALPQVLKKSGIENFVTSKIAWNDTNRMPYDAFYWQGIDGTEIFTYFITARGKDLIPTNDFYTTYVGDINASLLAGTRERFGGKKYNNDTIISFGYGDGGGGPTKKMLEMYDRYKKGFPGIPTAKMEFLNDFLSRVKGNLDNAKQFEPRIPKWVGELYLEYHRGTYTSAAKNKKNNRLSETKLSFAEFLSVMEKGFNSSSYPADKLNSAWKKVLLNQFHDILPGSSIKEVYEDTDISYAEVLTAANEIIDEKLSSIAKSVKTDGGILVFNPNSFAVSGAVELDGKEIFAKDIPAFGYKVVKPLEAEQKTNAAKTKIENKFFTVLFNKNGNIVSLFDKRNNREVVKSGAQFNLIEAYEDMPPVFDAWDIMADYDRKKWELNEVSNIETVQTEAGAGLKITKNFVNSTVTQTVFLYDEIDRIDVKNEIDWKESSILLKASFPTDIISDFATFDIQFGTIKRPTHRNTSWDEAKYEVCAHKFADLSEDNYGLSILNDCKYGYSVEGDTLKLTLLKSPVYPNPESDKCLHEFTYSIYPHAGDFKSSDAVKQAYSLNRPLKATAVGNNQNGTLPSEFSFLSASGEIIIETVKQAENGDGVIVRLYNPYNSKINTSLEFGIDVSKAFICDMTENEQNEIEVKQNRVNLDVSNFEIITLKVK